jgi:hypothetical protein
MVDRGSVDELGLAEAIEALRDDLLQARAAGATSDIRGWTWHCWRSTT